MLVRSYKISGSNPVLCLVITMSQGKGQVAQVARWPATLKASGCLRLLQADFKGEVTELFHFRSEDMAQKHFAGHQAHLHQIQSFRHNVRKGKQSSAVG